MNNEILTLDLNKLYTQQVKKQINDLEKDLNYYINKSNNLSTQNELLKNRISSSQKVILLLDNITKEFRKITRGDIDNGGWYDSQQKNQFIFIEKILLHLFGIEKEQGGWLSSRGDGQLSNYLAVNYYRHKETVISLLEILMNKPTKEIDFIKNFKMPYDWTSEKIIFFLKNPHSCTNGTYIGVSKFWVERGADKSNTPYDLIMKNPKILEGKVFLEFIDAIKQGRCNWYTLFGLPKYNNKISQDQINTIGQYLISMDTSFFQQQEIKYFINMNLIDLNKDILDYLFQFINSSSMHNMFYFEYFPIAYQYKHLKTKNIEKVLNILSHYSCKWSLNEKDKFLKDYYQIKKGN